MSLPCDWQIHKQKLLERSQYLLETGQWSDCKFLVGQEPNRQIMEGHKLFLAMSSPVFEAMFFGGVAEKNDIIYIRDVQPDAFKALLVYIYTDQVNLSSLELACELCYCAKKYMFPSLVQECTKFVWGDVTPKKACRAYEFAKLFEEPVLMEKCFQIICTATTDILKEASWLEVDIETLLTVLDQENLGITSEMELFTAVERWAEAECNRKSLDATDGKTLRSVIGNALSKIRFLSSKPQEFAEVAGMSPLLTKDEIFAILMNILCTGNKTPMPEGFSTNSQCRGILLKVSCSHIFSTPPHSQHLFNDAESSNALQNTHATLLKNDAIRNVKNLSENESSTIVFNGGTRKGLKLYCLRRIYEQLKCLNTGVLDCSLTFSVDKNICVLGVQVPTQIAIAPKNMDESINGCITYTEILYAHLQDSDGTRLTYTHFTAKVHTDTLVDIMFNRPIYIQKYKIYRVGVVFNRVGWYPIGVCAQNMTCDSVMFSFGDGETDNIQDGLIRSIVFTYNGINM